MPAARLRPLAFGSACAGIHAYDVELAILPESPMRYLMPWMFSLLALIAGVAGAADARERGFLREGMPEGEVLLKVGKPDHEAFVRNLRGQPEEKTWTYFPHARDPQTLTILTLRAGVVASIERKIAR